MLIAGIDEAGRGPCIGPLVLAITLIDKRDEEKLSAVGVKDSKLLSAKERESKFPVIKEIVKEFNFVSVSPRELDSLMVRKSLNEIEAMYAARLLESLSQKPIVVYVDSPDVVMQDFAKRIKKYVSFPIKIISEHKADVNFPVVAAASIIAKVKRDAAIKDLSLVYGDIGSGYPGDETTIKFLKNYLHEHNVLPDFVRTSWQTIKNLQEKKFQKNIFSKEW